MKKDNFKKWLALIIAVALVITSMTTGRHFLRADEEVPYETEDAIDQEQTEVPEEEAEGVPEEGSEEEAEEVPEEVAEEEPEEATEEPEDEIEYPKFDATVDSDQGNYSVTVNAEEGALPEGVKLKVREISVLSDEFANAKQAVAKEKGINDVAAFDENYGMAALDIGFTDAAGKKVEPVEGKFVDVQIDVKKLDNSISTDTEATSKLEVHHIDGISGKSETVAATDQVKVEKAVRTDGTVKVDENADTAKAEFKLDNFSVFTITWGYNNGSKATIKVVDEDGKEVAASTNTYRASDYKGKSLDLLSFVPEGTTFVSARLNSLTGTDVGESISANNNSWYYNGNQQIPNNATIYVIVDGDGANVKGTLDTVETIDSTSLGFNMIMFDYDSDVFGRNLGNYGDGTTKDGVVFARTLGADGYPVSTTGISAKGYVTQKGGTSANHLFLKNVYDSTKYLYYNSAENFAEYKAGNFTVYNQLGSPSNEDRYYMKRGNFMPYNTLDPTRSRYKNLYDYLGQALPTNAPRYNEPIYRFNEDPNYHFGLYGTTEFYMPVGGQIDNHGTKEDMIYEFTGDDDMVVYIDGTLVLDLGGIHDAQSGWINFRTGEVAYTDTPTGGATVWKSTTIKQMFEKAGTANKVDWNGNTFVDGTRHEFVIFYMERGEGASNLRIKLNIPPIPAGSIAVTKAVDNLNDTQLLNRSYTMHLTDASGQPVANAVGKIYGTQNSVTTDANGNFNISGNQTIVFSGLQANAKYYIQELTTEGYGVKYEVNSQIVQGDSAEVTVPSAKSANVRITNTAESGSIKVNKTFSGTVNNVAPEGFAATFTLYEANGEEWTQVASKEYSQFTNGSWTIDKLDRTKIYKVVETITNASGAQYEYVKTVAGLATAASGTDYTENPTVEGITVAEKQTTEVNFENVYQSKSYEVTVNKTFDINDLSKIPSNFEIDLAYNNTSKALKLTDEDVVATAGETASLVTYTWKVNIPYGTSVAYSEKNTDIAGYTLAQGTHSGTLTVGESGNDINITNTYTRDTGNLTIKKVLANDSDPVNIPADTTFTVTGPADFGTNGTATVKYSQFTDGVYKYTNVPSGDYTVVESDADIRGYELTTTYSPENKKASVVKGQTGKVTVTNKYTKIYDDDEKHIPGFDLKKVDDKGVAVDGVKFTLKNGNWSEEETTAAGGAAKFDFEGFDFGNDATKEYTFTLTETKPNGYTAAGPWTITVGEDGDKITVIEPTEEHNFFHRIWNWLIEKFNPSDGGWDAEKKVLTVVNTVDKTSVTAEKVWNDNDDKDELRPTEVEVQLYKKVGQSAETKVGDPVTLNEKGQWTTTWSDLPKYENNVAITYSVIEVEVPDEYTVTYEPSNHQTTSGTITITNSHPTQPEKTVYTGTSTTNIDGKPVAAGQEITYKIHYVNSMPSEVDARITDKIPAHTSFVSATQNGAYDETTGLVTWTKKVAVGGTFDVEMVVKVDDTTSGAVLTNKATVNDGNNTFYTNETENPTPTEPKKDVFASPESTTSIDGKQVKAGTTLTYKITYKNTTGDKLAKVTITDKIPANTKYVENTAFAGSARGTYRDGTITWDIADVENGQTIVAEFQVEVLENDGNPIKNSANVNDGTNDMDTNETVNPTPTDPEKHAYSTDASGAKIKIDGKEVQPGDVITYEITYKNTTGEDAENAKITDTIPEHTSYVEGSASDNGTISGKVITWELGTVAKDATKKVSFQVKVNELADVGGESIKNTAKVFDGTNTYDTNETVNPSPTAPTKDVFKNKNDVNDPEKSIDGQQVVAGQILTYTIKYSNTTGAEASVKITDKIPGNTTYVANSANLNGSEQNGTLTWNLTVPAGESRTVIFQVKVTDNNGSDVKNSAKVEVGNNTYNTNETVNPTPVETWNPLELTITKTDINTGNPITGAVFTLKDSNDKKVNDYKVDEDGKVTIKFDEDDDQLPGVGTYKLTETTNPDNYKTNNTVWTIEVKDDGTLDIRQDKTPVQWIHDLIFGSQTTVNVVNSAAVIPNTPEETDISVTKVWNDNNNADKTRPASVELQLYKNGNALYQDANGNFTTTNVDGSKAVTITLDGVADKTGEEKAWVATFTNLPKMEDGKAIVYTVKEDTVPSGYAVTYMNADGAKADAASNGGTVINSHQSVPEKTVWTSDSQTKIDGKVVEPGQILNYKISYTNSTGEDVDNVTITDSIPAHTTLVEGSAGNKATVNGSLITWNLGKVANGASVEVTFQVTVDPEIENLNGDVITNKATVNDGENTYNTNETKNPTPTKPEKDVFTETGTTSIDGSEVQPKDVLRYEITYKNTTGKEAAVEIADMIPAHTTYVEGSASNNGTFADGKVTWNLTLADKESITVDFKVKVDADVNGNPVKNSADAKVGGNTYTTNETVNPTPTEPEKDVFTTGTETSIDGKMVQAGDQLTYKITYKNTTGNTATAVITDKIPANTTLVAANDGGVASGDTITWTLADVPNGESVTVSFDVTVNANDGPMIKNQATARVGENDYKTNETSNPTPTVPVKDVFDSGDTTTSINGQTVRAGQELVYSITYTNTTGDTVNAVITDKIPANTTFVSAQNGGVEEKDIITWTLQGIPNGETRTVTFHVSVDENTGDPVLNDATVKAGDNEYKTNETKNPTPSEPEKTVYSGTSTTNIDGEEVQPNQILTYKISYTNSTSDDVTAEIVDYIPEHTSYVEGSVSEGGTFENDTLRWTIDVAKGASVEATFQVKVDADVNGNVLTNDAIVTDGFNEYGTNEVTNYTPTEPEKDVFASGSTVSIDNTQVVAGQRLTYAITYVNTTGADTNVTITDAIPENTTYVAGSASDNGIENNGKITWTLDVARGASKTVTFDVTVNKNDGTVVKNSADVIVGENEFEYKTNETTNPTPVESYNPLELIIRKTDQITGKAITGAVFTLKDSEGNKVNDYTIGEDGTVTIGFDKNDNPDVLPNEGTYSLEETTVPEGYQASETKWKVVVNDKVTIKEDKTPIQWIHDLLFGSDSTIEIVNNTAIVPNPPEDINVTVTKKWNDNKNADEVRPDDVTLQLYKDGKALYKDADGNYTTVETGNTPVRITLDGKADNSGENKAWEATFAQLPKMENNVEIQYTVKEVEVPDQYTVSYQDAEGTDAEAAPNGGVVTNSHQSHPEKTVFTEDNQIKIDDKVVQPGQILTYHIDYKNTTGETADKVTITDTIPVHTTYVEGSAGSDAAVNGGIITWTYENVADGESKNVSFQVVVDAAIDNLDGEVITNKANVFDGKNTTESNETKNPTPTRPEKDVFAEGEDSTSIDGSEVQPEDILTYQITYKNTTGEDAKAEIIDAIPEHTTYVKGSADNNGTYADGKVTWNVTVKNGKSVTVSLKVKVDADVNGALVKNTADVKVGGNTYTTNETVNPTPTEPKKDVFTTGTETSIDGKMVQAGDQLTYAITYKNTTGKITSATITDTIPDNTTLVAANDGGVVDGRTITWTLTNVLLNESRTVTFDVTVDENNGPMIENEATIKVGENEYKTNETQNPTPTTPVKDVFDAGDTETSINGKTVKAGQELVYTIAYTNTTGDTVDVEITDKVPANTTFKSADNGGKEEKDTITWTLKGVPNGESRIVSFQVTVDENTGDPVLNDAAVKVGDNEYETNQTKNPTPTEPEKTVYSGTSKTNIDGEEVQPKDTLTYNISYTNSTSDPVIATISDAIPQHTTYVDGSATKGGTFEDGTITWTVDVEVGATVEVSFQVTVDADVNGAVLTNGATVNDGNNDYETNEVHNYTPTEPKKEVFTNSEETNIDGNVVEPGQELTYEITYKNTTGAETTAEITDAIPEHTTYVADSASDGGEFADGKLTWTLENVPDGETKTVSFKVTVDDTVSGGEITNTANIRVGNNSYDTNETRNPVAVQAPIEGIKTLVDGNGNAVAMTAGQFRFNLMDEKNNVIDTAKNDESGAIVFNRHLFREAGLYRFFIQEQNPGEMVNGITYDEGIYEVDIEVTASENGTLNASVTYPEGNTIVNRTNTFILTAQKNLSGRNQVAGEFTFYAYRNSDPESVVATATNDADGKVVFTGIEYDAMGYTVTEQNTGDSEITYDTGSITYDPEGNIISEKTAFENTYTKNPILLRVQKRSKEAPYDPLVGATYGLYQVVDDGNSILVEAKVSDSEGYMYYGKIQPDTIYYFQEIAAPEGHEVDPYPGERFQVKYEYDENGAVTGIGVYDETGTIKTYVSDITVQDPDVDSQVAVTDDVEELKSGANQDIFKATTDDGTIEATAVADKGVLPDGTTMKVTKLTGEELATAEKQTTDAIGDFKPIAYYDVSFFDEDGSEIEPEAGSVTVTLTYVDDGEAMNGADRSELRMVHIVENESAGSVDVTSISGSVAANDTAVKQISFIADHFSVFGLGSGSGSNYQVTQAGVADQVSEVNIAKIDTAGNYVKNAKLAIINETTGATEASWNTADGMKKFRRWFDDAQTKSLNVDQIYILRELEAPAGFQKADDIYFSLNPYDSSLTVYKKSANGSLEVDTAAMTALVNDTTLRMIDIPIVYTENKRVDEVRRPGTVLTVTSADKVMTVQNVVAPQTGDVTAEGWIALILLAAGIVVFLFVRRRNAK